MDSDIGVAEVKLQQDRRQSDRGHHDDCSQAVKRGAAGEDHDEADGSHEKPGGNHRPAAVCRGRIGTLIGHGEVGRDRPIVDTSWFGGEWDLWAERRLYLSKTAFSCKCRPYGTRWTDVAG